MKNRFLVLWLIWTLFGAALVYFVASSGSKNSFSAVIAMVISSAPLFGLMLALGSNKAMQEFNHWLHTDKRSIYYTTGGLTFLFAFPGLLTGTFDPYTTTIFGVIVFAVFGSLRQRKNSSFDWNDIALWLLLWIPFDLRWSMEMHPLMNYSWWAVAISVIALIGWNGYRNAAVGFDLVPKLKDFKVALLALLMIMVVLIPPGLLTGFLSFALPEKYDTSKLAIHFIGIFLTIALPEELFFRGILLKGLEKVSSKKWVPMVVSSVAFGLMHWNNISGLSMQITYVLLATVAGAGYGWAYKKSGNNLLAAILTHTLVDWVWKLFLAA